MISQSQVNMCDRQYEQASQYHHCVRVIDHAVRIWLDSFILSNMKISQHKKCDELLSHIK